MVVLVNSSVRDSRIPDDTFVISSFKVFLCSTLYVINLASIFFDTNLAFSPSLCRHFTFPPSGQGAKEAGEPPRAHHSAKCKIYGLAYPSGRIIWGDKSQVLTGPLAAAAAVAPLRPPPLASNCRCRPRFAYVLSNLPAGAPASGIQINM